MCATKHRSIHQSAFIPTAHIHSSHLYHLHPMFHHLFKRFKSSHPYTFVPLSHSISTILRRLPLPAVIVLSSINMSTATSSPDWKSVSDTEWKKRLTPEQFKILRLKGTGKLICCCCIGFPSKPSSACYSMLCCGAVQCFSSCSLSVTVTLTLASLCDLSSLSLVLHSTPRAASVHRVSGHW